MGLKWSQFESSDSSWVMLGKVGMAQAEWSMPGGEYKSIGSSQGLMGLCATQWNQVKLSWIGIFNKKSSPVSEAVFCEKRSTFLHKKTNLSQDNL